MIMAAPMPRLSLAARWKNFWRDRVLGVIVSQLKQGISPQKVALAVALGLCLAVFPILGATTLLCFTCGVWLNLNQPVIQLVNWLASPLQLLLIPAFVRFGESLVRADRVSFSIPELFAKFHASPLQFFREFGLTGVHGIIGWVVAAPFAGIIVYRLLLPVTKRLARESRPDPKT